MIGRTCRLGSLTPLRPRYRPWRRDAGHWVIVLDNWAGLTYVPHGGWRLTVIRMGGPFGEIAWERPPKWRRRVRRPSVPDPDPGDPRKGLAADNATVLFESLPDLVRFFTATRYDDGTVRQPGWIQVKIFNGSWQTVLKDRDSGLQLSVLAPTLDDSLALAEAMLRSDKAPWEVDPWANKSGRKKK